MSRSLLIDSSPFSTQFVEKPPAYDAKVERKSVPAKSTQKINSIYRQIQEACSSVKQAATEGARRFKSGYVFGLKLSIVRMIAVSQLYSIFPTLLLANETDPVLMEREKKADAQMSNLGFMETVIIAPVMEELLFRGLCQDILLYRLPRLMLKKIVPGKETLLDSKLAKACRIGITSVGFGLVHILNGHKDRYRQAAYATVGGIGYGLLKESKVGIIGSIAAHMGGNSLALLLMRLASLSKKNADPN